MVNASDVSSVTPLDKRGVPQGAMFYEFTIENLSHRISGRAQRQSAEPYRQRP